MTPVLDTTSSKDWTVNASRMRTAAHMISEVGYTASPEYASESGYSVNLALCKGALCVAREDKEERHTPACTGLRDRFSGYLVMLGLMQQTSAALCNELGWWEKEHPLGDLQAIRLLMSAASILEQHAAGYAVRAAGL